jgi:hypothetical protein
MIEVTATDKSFARGSEQLNKGKKQDNRVSYSKSISKL